jgi:hypothetical protein
MSNSTHTVEDFNMENAFVKYLSSIGLDAKSYVKKYNRPGLGTIERYVEGDQDPITANGNWRSAPQKIADKLCVAVEILFPEAAEKRQQILDEQSVLDAEASFPLLSCTKCPKTIEEDGRASFVIVDLTCVTCTYKKELTSDKLICNHPRAKELIEP